MKKHLFILMCIILCAGTVSYTHLRHMYGNYMEIPPKEKREQHVVLKYLV